MDGHVVVAPDVIVAGANMYIVHNSIEQPPAAVSWVHSVRIHEDEFINLDGTPVTRDQFMNVLVNVTGIYIRATYEAEGQTTRSV